MMSLEEARRKIEMLRTITVERGATVAEEEQAKNLIGKLLQKYPELHVLPKNALSADNYAWLAVALGAFVGGLAAAFGLVATGFLSGKAEKKV
jgi:hypothetical protein